MAACLQCAIDADQEGDIDLLADACAALQDFHALSLLPNTFDYHMQSRLTDTLNYCAD